ncbi:MAG: hypothetical protein GY810_26020 [Aureispira sp.]|nr:hypothetical protein [Aureispira sp.]
MKKLNIKSLALLGLTALFLGSCATDAPDSSAEPITIDSTESGLSRTFDKKIKPLSLEEAFLKLPLHLEGIDILDELSKKERKSLLEEGKIDGLTASKTGNVLTIQEDFQNTDDDNEQATLLELVTFIKKDKKTLLFVSAYSIEEQNSNKILSQQQLFLEYNGTAWNDAAYQIPEISLQDFYAEDFDVSALTETHIEWELDKNDPSKINAIIQYDKYADGPISKDELITKESNQVSLVWQESFFKKQQTPLE